MPVPSRRGGWVALTMLAGVLGAAPPAHADDDAAITAALVAALPADARTDVVLIDQPARADAPRVRAVTQVAAPPAAIKTALLDATRYRALIPSLIKSDVERPGVPGTGTPVVDWEL